MFQVIALTDFVFTDCYLIIVLIFFVNGQVNMLQYALPLYNLQNAGKEQAQPKAKPEKKKPPPKKEVKPSESEEEDDDDEDDDDDEEEEEDVDDDDDGMLMLLITGKFNPVQNKEYKSMESDSLNFNFLNLAITGTKSFFPFSLSNSVILWYFTPDVLIYPSFQIYFCSLGG